MAKGANAYGIKEVADVSFYPITAGEGFVYVTGATYDEATGKVTLTWSSGSAPTAAYNFDSLKISNIEVGSEEVSATGGRGNPELISWSYGKTVTLTVTDALFSMDTLDLMFGGKEVAGADSKILTIDAKTFPGNYSIVGTAVIRNFETGNDEPFVFYMPKAHPQVGGTLTMEADGDPSTFEMTIKGLAQKCGDDEDVLIRFIRATKSSS